MSKHFTPKEVLKIVNKYSSQNEIKKLNVVELPKNKKIGKYPGIIKMYEDIGLSVNPQAPPRSIRQFVEASEALGYRMMKEGGNNSKQRIEYAFRWATSRRPDMDELNILESLFNEELDEFRKYPERAEEFLQIGELNDKDNIDIPEFAAYGVVANAIINLSESLQKN